MNKPIKVSVEIRVSCDKSTFDTTTIAQVKREESCAVEGLIQDTITSLSNDCARSARKQFECAQQIEQLEAAKAEEAKGKKA